MEAMVYNHWRQGETLYIATSDPFRGRTCYRRDESNGELRYAALHYGPKCGRYVIGVTWKN